MIHQLDTPTVFMEENWKDIDGYDGMYAISNLARVKSLNRVITINGGNTRRIKERICKIMKTIGGYDMAVLCRNGTEKKFLLHRLVATAFIPNPENKPHINHRNGITNDNRIENLEWCTRSENMQHAYDFLRKRTTGKAIIQLDMNSIPVEEYKSTEAATKELKGIYHWGILSCLRGERSHYKGFKWVYKSDYQQQLSKYINPSRTLLIDVENSFCECISRIGIEGTEHGKWICKSCGKEVNH